MLRFTGLASKSAARLQQSASRAFPSRQKMVASKTPITALMGGGANQNYAARSFASLLPPNNSADRDSSKPETTQKDQVTSILPGNISKNSESEATKQAVTSMPQNVDSGKSEPTKKAKKERKRRRHKTTLPRPRKKNDTSSSNTGRIAKSIKTSPNTISKWPIEQEYQKWYEEQHGKRFQDTCIELNLIRPQKEFTMWSALFHGPATPATGEIFPCGKLASLENREEKMENDDQVLYFQMAEARQGCVNSALNCFRYRRGKSSAYDRYCAEMPALAPADTDTCCDAIAATLTVAREDSEHDKGCYGGELYDELLIAEDNSDDCLGSDEDDDEEYNIQYLPGTASGDGVHFTAANPLARVMGSWNEIPRAAQSKDIHSIPAIMAVHPEEELRQQIENAHEWIKQERPDSSEGGDSAHRVMLHGTHYSKTLDLGNNILHGLAEAHRRAKFQDVPRGVEQVAKKILNYLWSTRSARPNADTYIAYLCCLEGPDRKAVADRAKAILEKMIQGATVDARRDETYPKPTIGVFNTVVQLCAQVGGQSGRYDLTSVENPNRQTFLSALSCMAFPPSIDGEIGGFDPIFAQTCIDQMKGMSKRDSSLTPDTEIYNAGLRWSGGILSTFSRPHMIRPVPWDSHADILQGGFQKLDVDNAMVQDAYRMHAWIEDMFAIGDTTAPNIETYESVMQAYVRTGTLEGLQQAEALLESLLRDPILASRLRMQSFHPVLAAWAYSGHEHGPLKVNRWINRLATLSEDPGHDVQLDGRIGEVALIAKASRLIRCLEQQRELSTTETEELLNCAHGCSIHLQDLCVSRANYSAASYESNILINAEMFVLVMNVWGKLGLHFLKSEMGDRALGTLGMLTEIVAEFEGLISTLDQKQPSNSDHELQLRHLTSNAYKIYSVLFSLLKDSTKVPQKKDSPWLLENRISSIERWVRRINELCAVNNSNTPAMSSVYEMLYSDMYSYIASGSRATKGCSDTAAIFMVQILEALNEDFPERVPVQRRGDLVRLCFLAVDLLSEQNYESSVTSTYKNLVATICRVAKGPGEQAALLDCLSDRIEMLRERRPIGPVDHDAIIREIKKKGQCLGTVASGAKRSSQGRYHNQKLRRGRISSQNGSRSQSRNKSTKESASKREVKKMLESTV